MTDAGQLIQTAKSWVAQDFDPETIVELTQLIDRSVDDPAALAELKNRFSGPLKFGTAGLRAEVAAGESRMNRATVAKSAWGVTQWLLSQQRKTLIVGADARTGSSDFAADTCAIASALGLEVIQLESPLPTPVLAFALTTLKADAAIMVTASHNPAKDNGYKVYDHTGSQITSPSDVEIAQLIATAPPANQIDRSGKFQTIQMIDRYVDFVASKASYVLNPELKIAYTAMHGVGSTAFNRLMHKVGYRNIVEVAAQKDPDPQFPTVAFPNPEEPGAMDLLLQLAIDADADIAIANDPDADRTAIAVPTTTGWQVLSGDELGALLAWWCIKRREINNQPIVGAMAASIVSSSMSQRIATANNLEFSFTLTGFKYVSRVPNLIYGYEEALGYCVLPEQIRDKDGISAALFAVELVSYLKSQRISVTEQLRALYVEYGMVLTKQITLRMQDIEAVSRKLLQITSNLPTYLGEFPLTKVENFSDGIDGLPKSSGIRLSFATGRVIIRPSGTEPKLKCYIEVTGDPAADPEAMQSELVAQLGQLELALAKLFE